MPKEISFDQNDPKLLSLLGKVGPFQGLHKQELKSIIRGLKKMKYEKGEIVVQEGEIGSSAYIVAQGQFHLSIMGRTSKIFQVGDFFGEIALIDARPRMGTVRALTDAVLYSIEGKDLENETILSTKTALKIYRGFARLITSYIREGSNLYREMDVLLVQDGGCAPGYNPVTAFISEYLEKAGRKVYICAQGFKSLILNRSQDYRYLIYNWDLYRQMEHIPGVVFSPPLRESRGANFRCERFPEFKALKNHKIAAKNIIARKVRVLVAIGGNGTFAGINSLSRLLPSKFQCFFVPVTIDSDIFGTDCVGEFTGVEVGAEKIRCYMADARTHKRYYIIEMMGAQGGYHALHSCLGAGAHLAVLPSSNYDMPRVAQALSKLENAVIVVAEGYKSQKRKSIGFKGNAAEFFRDELLKSGLKTSCRIICEPFSRDIRGAEPNNLDIMLAQRMARKLSELIENGNTKKMPAVLSGREYSIPFTKIKTDNSVTSELATLANRLTIV
jgi:6-phosphofructokinase 1